MINFRNIKIEEEHPENYPEDILDEIADESKISDADLDLLLEVTESDDVQADVSDNTIDNFVISAESKPDLSNRIELYRDLESKLIARFSKGQDVVLKKPDHINLNELPFKDAKTKSKAKLVSSKISQAKKKNPLEAFINDHSSVTKAHKIKHKSVSGLNLSSIFDHDDTKSIDKPSQLTPIDKDIFNDSLESMAKQSQKMLAGTRATDLFPTEVLNADNVNKSTSSDSTIFMDLDDSLAEAQSGKGLLVNKGQDDELVDVDLDSLFSGTVVEDAVDLDTQHQQIFDEIADFEAKDMAKHHKEDDQPDKTKNTTKEVIPVVDTVDIDKNKQNMWPDVKRHTKSKLGKPLGIKSKKSANVSAESNNQVIDEHIQVDDTSWYDKTQLHECSKTQDLEEDYLQDIFAPENEFDKILCEETPVVANNQSKEIQSEKIQSKESKSEMAVDPVLNCAVDESSSVDTAELLSLDDEFGDHIFDELEDVSSLINETKAPDNIGNIKPKIQKSSALAALNDMMSDLDEPKETANAKLNTPSKSTSNIKDIFTKFMVILQKMLKLPMVRLKIFYDRIANIFQPIGDWIRSIPGLENLSFSMRDWAGYLGSVVLFILVMDNILRRW